MAQNDEFGYHEVVHTAAVISDLWDRQIVGHGAVNENEKLKVMADELNNMLYEFYQKFSQLRMEKFHNTKIKITKKDKR